MSESLLHSLSNFLGPWTGGTISISLHTFELPITITILKTEHHPRSRQIVINIHCLLTSNATLSPSLTKLLLKHNLETNMALCWGTALLLGHHCFAGRWLYAFFDVLSKWYGSLWECSIEQTLIYHWYMYVHCPFISMLFLFQLFSSRDILESVQYSTDDCPQLRKNSQCILSPQCPRNFISSFLSALPGLTDLVIIYLHFLENMMMSKNISFLRRASW